MNAEMKLEEGLQEEVSLLLRSRIYLLEVQSCRPAGVRVMSDGWVNN